MRILAIDPGGMNGLAWFKEDYQLEGFAQVKLDDLVLWLENHEPKPELVILEDYRLWKHKALQQSGSNMPASRGIGHVESYCTRNRIKLVKQSPQVLEPAQKMSQMKMPSDHSQSHWVSAYNHAYWYMVKQGFRQVEMAEEDK